jgi:hypothetical protein
MSGEIINKVAQSSLVSFDLETLFDQRPRACFDLKEMLFQGLILREKDFRLALKEHDWTQYQDKNVAVFCSADAIVPTWAYMLVAGYLSPVAHYFVFGSLEVLEEALFREALQALDLSNFDDAKVVVKGCSKVQVPTSAYMELSRLLLPRVQSLMFGEPCSTVPVYKKAKKA